MTRIGSVKVKIVKRGLGRATNQTLEQLNSIETIEIQIAIGPFEGIQIDIDAETAKIGPSKIMAQVAAKESGFATEIDHSLYFARSGHSTPVDFTLKNLIAERNRFQVSRLHNYAGRIRAGFRAKPQQPGG
jgi:hypothetical protein